MADCDKLLTLYGLHPSAHICGDPVYFAHDIVAALWPAADFLEQLALEWEADIRFNAMSDGSDAGPSVKICPREQCDRETLELRIATVRRAALLLARWPEGGAS